MNVGLHYGIPADQYHADCADEPSLNCSTVKTIIGESLRKAWFQHPRLNPKYVRKEDDKFDIGTCTHSVLLENDATKIVIAPFDDWRKKEAQEIRKAARKSGRYFPGMVEVLPLADPETYVGTLIRTAGTRR